MTRRYPSIDELAEAIRRLVDDMAVGSEGRCFGRRRVWAPGQWPAGRRALLRRYDNCLLAAADMLGVELAPRAEWTRPGFRGGLFGDETRTCIEEALESAGFHPFAAPPCAGAPGNAP